MRALRASSVRNDLLYGCDELVAEWVQRQCGGGKIAELAVAIGYFVRGEIAAGVMFFCYRKPDIQVALAVKQPTVFTLGFARAFREVLLHPMRHMGCTRITAEIEVSNERSWRQAVGWGFEIEGRKRNAAPDGGDVLVLGLLNGTGFLK
jgi:hypothetical protein